MEVIYLEAPGDLIDVSRLDADERQLWDEMFSRDSGTSDAPAIRIWSFGYACMLELRGVPEVVLEYLREVDPDNLISQYLANVQRARWKGRL